MGLYDDSMNDFVTNLPKQHPVVRGIYSGNVVSGQCHHLIIEDADSNCDRQKN